MPLFNIKGTANFDERSRDPVDYDLNSVLQKALFKDTGEKTTFGKVSDFATLGIPGEAVGRDLRSQNVTGRYEDNLMESIDKSQSARKTTIGAAKTAVGVASGNPTLIASGAQSIGRGVHGYSNPDEEPQSISENLIDTVLSNTSSLSSLLKSSGGNKMGKSSNKNISTDINKAQYSPGKAKKVKGNIDLPEFEEGIKLKGSSHEDGGIDLIDALTGELVGEAEGGERVFSKKDTKRIERDVKEGDKDDLMKHVEIALERQNKNKTQYMQKGGKTKKNGSPSRLKGELEKIAEDLSLITHGQEPKNYPNSSFSKLSNQYKSKLKKYIEQAKPRAKTFYLTSNAPNRKELLKNIDNIKVNGDKITLKRGSKTQKINMYDAVNSPINTLDAINKAIGISNDVLKTPPSKEGSGGAHMDKIVQDETEIALSNATDDGDVGTDDGDVGTDDGGLKKLDRPEMMEDESFANIVDKGRELTDDEAFGPTGAAPMADTADIDLPDDDPEDKRESEVMNGFLDGALSAGNVLDLLKVGVGIKAATQELPEYQIPSAWQEYTNTLETMASEGLSDAEEALYNQQSERTYAYDVESISEGAGGSAARYLGNLGAAAQRKYQSDRELAAIDAQELDRDLQRYGQALQVTNEMKRRQFEDEYKEAMLTKRSGASLASSGVQGILDRIQYERSYGEGSEYDQLFDLKQEQIRESNELLDLQQENYIDYLEGFESSPNTSMNVVDNKNKGQ